MQESIYEFLNGKNYDESDSWPDMTIKYDSNNVLSVFYFDGEIRSLGRYRLSCNDVIKIIIDDLNGWKNEKNEKLLKELQENYPEYFI